MRSLPIALVASACLGLTTTAGADSYVFRSKPLVAPPQAFEFAPVAAEPSTLAVSLPTRVRGHGGRSASVSGGEYQICGDGTCSTGSGSWSREPMPNVPGDFHVRMRVPAAPFGESASARLAVGGFSATFVATTRVRNATPKPITATDVFNAEPWAEQLTIPSELTGHDGINLSVSGASAQYRVCNVSSCADMGGGGWTTSTGPATEGQFVQIRLVAGDLGAERAATLSYGTRTLVWTVKSRAGPTPVSVSEMGLTHSGLRDALSRALGSGLWTECADSSDLSRCRGASETLLVFSKASTGHEYGIWVRGDFSSHTGCWVLRPGFYFSTVATAAGFLVDSKGNGTRSGNIEACSSIQVMPLTFANPQTIRGYSDQGSGSNPTDAWRTGYTLNGGAGGVATSAQIRWYRR